MKRSKCFVCVFSLILLLCVMTSCAFGEAQSQGILYRVTGGKNDMFLLGSIHVGSRDMYPMSEAITQALKQADMLVFECDTESAEAMQATLGLMSYPVGETLDEHIASATREMLERVAEQTGYPLAMLLGFKPWAVVSLFALETTAAEMGTADIAEAMELGVETQVKNLAGEKSIRYLETTCEQLEMMDGFSPALQEYMLLTTCNAILYPDQISGMDATLREWPEWWRNGNAEAFANAYLQGMEMEPYPELMQEYHSQLVTARNVRMADGLAVMLEEEDAHSFFVTVGLLHLVLPEDSVVAELEKMGYMVERIMQ